MMIELEKYDDPLFEHVIVFKCKNCQSWNLMANIFFSSKQLEEIEKHLMNCKPDHWTDDYINDKVRIIVCPFCLEFKMLCQLPLTDNANISYTKHLNNCKKREEV